MKISTLLLISLATCSHGQWETVEHEGSSFVTARSIARFYKFESFAEKNGSLLFENKILECALPLEGRFASMNGLKVDVEHPVVRSEDRFLVPRITVTNTLEPLLRPRYLMLKQPRKRVFLLADPKSGEVAASLVEAIHTELTHPPLPLKVDKLSGDWLASGHPQGLKYVNRFGDGILILVRLSEGDGQRLRTRVLAPVGVAGLGNGFRKAHLEPVPGNAVDKASLALGVAVHGVIVKRLGPATDAGLVRSRDPWLKGSTQPSMILELTVTNTDGDAIKAAGSGIGKDIRQGLLGFLQATARGARVSP